MFCSISYHGTKCAQSVGRNSNVQLVVRISSSSKWSSEPKEGEPQEPGRTPNKKGLDLGKISSLNNAILKVLRTNYEESLKVGNDYIQKKLVLLNQRANLSGNAWYSDKVGFWMKRYENFVGLTEVKAAQQRVVEAESQFIEAQDVRRETQLSVNDVQKKVKEIHAELERTHRGEDRYLTLVTQEHQILKEDRLLTEQLVQLEKVERLRFSELSNAVRDSHEKERSQAEKTKYWSVIGSIVGTCIGIFGTTINNRLRMNELRQIVKDASNGVVVEGSTALHAMADLQKSIDTQKENLSNLNMQLKEILPKIITAGSNYSQINSRIMNLDNTQTRSESQRQTQIDASLSKAIQDHFSDFKSYLQVQNVKSTDAYLRSIQLLQTQTEARIVDSVNKSNSASYKSFHTRACEIDEKVKDIRSLILTQTIPSSRRNTKTPNVVEKGVSGDVDYLVAKPPEDLTVNHGFFVGVVAGALLYLIVNKIF